MANPRIYADFHNADTHGRLRLNCIGTIEDLAREQIQLHDGLIVSLYADDLDDSGQPNELVVEGVVAYSREESCWVAAIDWNAIRHPSDDLSWPANGASPTMPQSNTNPSCGKAP